MRLQLPLDLFSAKELAGEELPSFAAMRRLYELANDLFGFRPWQILSESELIVKRDSKSGEPWYCSVMGSMQAYCGERRLCLVCSIAAEDLANPGEVLASMCCLSVEFVPRKDLMRRGSRPSAPWPTSCPVLDELRDQPAPQGDLDYLRLKLRQVIARPPANGQKKTFLQER